jgi:26S proteasome regulatory subunit N2
VGLGRLGTRTAKIAQAFDMKVIAWSPHLTPERCTVANVDYASKEQLFRQSDFVSLHMALRAPTHGMITAADLALMKPTAYLINTARGPLIDEAALLEVLRTRKIAGAGLDVFDIEPLPLDHPFRKLPNVVLSPHLGYVTAENYRVAYAGTVEAVRAYLNGHPIRTITQQA